MKGDGHLYIVNDANGKPLRHGYRIRYIAEHKAAEIGGHVDIIPNGAKQTRSDAGGGEAPGEAGGTREAGAGEAAGEAGEV